MGGVREGVETSRGDTDVSTAWGRQARFTHKDRVEYNAVASFFLKPVVAVGNKKIT